MKLFNKTERCNIDVNEVTNFKLQKFADEHCAEHSIVEIKGWASGGQKNLVVSFNTKKKQSNIYRDLKKEFGNEYDVNIIHKQLISLTKKQGA